MHLGRFWLRFAATGFGGVAEAEEAQRRAASRWAFCRTLAGDDYLLYRLLSLAAARSKHSNRAALSECPSGENRPRLSHRSVPAPTALGSLRPRPKHRL